MTQPPVITIDGAGGTGKGTVSRLLASRLGWHILDSGALYRVLAHVAMERAVSCSDIEALWQLLHELNTEFRLTREGVEIFLHGTNISAQIRTEACGNAASKIACIETVRSALLGWQHSFLKPPGLIADGRDMGTKVFPTAPLKFFLVTDLQERAQRRYKQLKQNDANANLDKVYRGIEERDLRDISRAVSPLKPAPDAIIVDTTHCSIEAVLDRVTKEVDNVLPNIAEIQSC